MTFYRRSNSDVVTGKTHKKWHRHSLIGQTLNFFVGGSDEDSCDETPDLPTHRELHIPRGDAWMQASFNAAAFVFVFIMGCIVLSVYYILEPFLHPLLWAILVGMVLHPFKHVCTSEIHDWLAYLESSDIPLSLGVVLSPLHLFSWLAQCFETIFFSNWKMIVGLVVGTVTMVTAYLLNLPLYALSLIKTSSVLVESISEFMVDTALLQACSLLLCFVLLLVTFNNFSSYKTALKALSVCFWFLVLLNIGVHLIGSVTVPLVCGLFLSAIVGSFVTTFKEETDKFKVTQAKEQKDGDNGKELLEKALTQDRLQKLLSQDSELEADIRGTDTPEEDAGVFPVESAQEDTPPKTDKKQVSFNPMLRAYREGSPSPSSSPRHSPQSPRAMEHHLPIYYEPPKRGKPKPRAGDGGSQQKKLAPSREDILAARAQCDQIFLVLVIACLLAVLWKHPMLFLIPLPLTLWCVVKYAVTLAVVQNLVPNKLYISTQTAQKWLHSQKKLLCPWPMPTMFAMYLFLDKKILKVVKKTMGSLVSALIIFLLLVVLLAVTVLLLFQIRVEVMHYASTTASVWNTTVASNPQIIEWIGVSQENKTLQDSLENFANENYAYARKMLGDWIHKLVSDSATNTSMMEQRVLELFDRLYSFYVIQNASAVPSFVSPTVGVTDAGVTASSNESILRTFTNLLPLINIDTTLTVLKSVWSLLSENFAMAFSFLYTFLGLLFSGGTVLLNSIVFLSALFYLLSYSDHDYLPVKWVMDFLPHLSPSTKSKAGGGGDGCKESGSKDYGKAFSRAIRSVFHATLRRAIFYGLYIWLIHSLFGLPVSILPAVLASLAGAIPFIGAYWVALPAVLELWLLQGHLFWALTFFTLTVLPVFFVDTLINREIEGSHPYLTGLAIAGGIYFAGLEGALLGPILLSCLLFVMDFYGTSFV